MAATTGDLMTAGNIAKQLSVSGGQVKKAIQGLKIKPSVVKGGCSYYSKETVARIKSALK